MKTLIGFLVMLASITVLIIAVGCSELKENLPPATATIGVHPSGWLVKGSPEFHGQAIRLQSWDMRGCKTCHGQRYDGGSSDVSCLTCHDKPLGPENCTTCHGGVTNAPPPDLDGNTNVTARGVGAHQTHLFGTASSRAVLCSECHILPGGTYSAGHVDSDRPAEINFRVGGISRTPSGGVTPNPTYNSTAGSCGTTYCHGAFKNGNSAGLVWNAGSISVTACGTCHGNPSAGSLAQKALPGGTHPNDLNCSSCHGGVVNASLGFVNASRHIDGKLNLNGQDVSF